MSGIVFLASAAHDDVVEFYVEDVGATVWLDQPGCTILEFDGFRFGFCDRSPADTCGILTFYYDDRAAVDRAHDRMGDRARGPPEVNEEYDIYQCFADDPEGRTVEFQTFLHPLPGGDDGGDGDDD